MTRLTRLSEARVLPFLLIPPVFFVLAELWLVFTARTRRAPEIEATIEAHERFRQAMTSVRPVAPRAGHDTSSGEKARRSTIDA